jgi:hypothetical protein
MNARLTGLIGASALAVLLLASCSTKAPTAADPKTLDEAPVPIGPGVVLNEDLPDRQIFPAGDGWNLDASQAPVDPNSQAYIDWISGRTAENPTVVTRPQAYFGPPPWGIPYVCVSGTQPLLPVSVLYWPTESDLGAPGRPPGYPIPEEAKCLPGYIEGNVPGGGTIGDRHLIVVDRDNGLLFESWATRWNESAQRWEIGAGAVFDLAAGSSRPGGRTSAIESGQALFPGLVRYGEAYGSSEITHAFCASLRGSNGYVWPASHTANSTAGAPPLGARLRLKASVDLSRYAPPIQRIFRAMQTHGLIVVGNGGCDLVVGGTMDPRWDSRVIYPAFYTLTADDFEVVQLGWGAPAPEAR